MTSKKKKGFAALNIIPVAIMIMMISGFLLGAAYISLGSFKNSTNGTAGSTTYKAYQGIGYVEQGLDSVAQNFPLIGTILVIIIIMSAIMGLWGFFRSKSSGGMGA